jgi:hypothetical protein
VASAESMQELKIRLLRTLYKRRDCNIQGVSFFDLLPELGLDQKKTESLARELDNNNLLRFYGQDLTITPYGIDEIEVVDSDKPEVQELQSNRLMVLRKYYDIQDDYYGAAPSEIAQQIGLEEKVVEDIAWYYSHKNFLMAPTIGPKLKITYEGRR